MANKWLQHLNKFRKQNSGMDAKDVMREARKTYQSGGGGNGEVTPYQPTNLASTASSLQGGRRRRSRRQQTSRRRSSSRRSRQTRRR